MSIQESTVNKNADDRVLDRIKNGQPSALPQFAGSWDLVNTLGPWRIYLIHDPCHDDFIGRKDDRNTVIALHDEKGIWRILGRELDQVFAMKIACGEC